jgi:hypothetical protein
MEMVELTSFGEIFKAHILQDLLQAEGIESVLQGENLNQVLSCFDIRVMVWEKDLEQALNILKESFPEQYPI